MVLLRMTHELFKFMNRDAFRGSDFLFNSVAYETKDFDYYWIWGELRGGVRAGVGTSRCGGGAGAY